MRSRRPLDGSNTRSCPIYLTIMSTKLRTGTANVLADLGFEDADEISAKAILAVKVNKLISVQALNQAAAARILDMPRTRLAAIRKYKLQSITPDELTHALTKLAADCANESG